MPTKFTCIGVRALFYNFNFDSKYMKMFRELGINVELMLREAGIPHRAVENKKYQLTHDQYKGLIKAFDRQIHAEMVLEFSKLESVAMFVPEFFAGLCANNGVNCVNRIAKYKKIIAPVNMIVDHQEETTVISYEYNDGDPLPRAILMNAQISILSIIRQGTGLNHISPIKVTADFEYPKNAVVYMGIQPELSSTNKMVFSNEDLKRPFITENNRMWSYLEPELNQRLREMETDNSFSATVRKTLFEVIPSGVSDAERIAFELGMSKRTLQRRLNDEGTTYNEQLNHTRELLVRNYLKTGMSLDEIAFLVNYMDAKSLSRAFKTWTGMSVSHYRLKFVHQQ